MLVDAYCGRLAEAKQFRNLRCLEEIIEVDLAPHPLNGSCTRSTLAVWLRQNNN